MLYKYLDPERLEFLKNFRIRFTKPGCLNDPIECIPKIQLNDIDNHIQKIVKRNFNKIISKHGLNKNTISALKHAENQLSIEYKNNPNVFSNMVLTKHRDVMNRTFGVLSLSESYDSELLWSYYTNNHEGFVIGFDENNDFFKRQKNDRPDCGKLYKVIYHDDRIIIDVDKYKIPIQLLYTKKRVWSHEKEVRMIRELKNADDVLDINDQKVHLFKIPKNAIVEIIFGININDKTRSKIIDIINNDSDLKHILIKKCIYNNSGEFKIIKNDK